MIRPDILYEDNHLLFVNKAAGMPVQGDKSGDESVLDVMKSFIKKRDDKPGRVFMGLPHRLDRPTSGILVLAKTSKALSRLAASFREGTIEKIYWAIVDKAPVPPEGQLLDWLIKDGRSNTSDRVPPGSRGAKEAILNYRLLESSKTCHLLEIHLITGRHHQIRVQLASIGSVVKGDLKYGSRRSNPGGGILLHARRITLPHPVRQERLCLEAPLPEGAIWNLFRERFPGKPGGGSADKK